MERETGLEPATSSLGISASIEYKGHGVHRGDTDPWSSSNLRPLLPTLGQSLDAEKAISRLLDLSKSKYVACEIAAAYASAGHSDQALMWLERAITERSTCIPWLRTGHFGGVLNPFWDLKGNRQYQAILARAVSNQ